MAKKPCLDSLSTVGGDQPRAEKVLNHLLLGPGAPGCLPKLDAQVRRSKGMAQGGRLMPTLQDEARTGTVGCS